MCKKFELLENDFIRDPSDLATYIVRITEELHKVGIRMIQETLEDMNAMLNASANEEEIVREQCRAREDALRRERTLERDKKILQAEKQDLLNRNASLQDENATLQDEISRLQEQLAKLLDK